MKNINENQMKILHKNCKKFLIWLSHGGTWLSSEDKEFYCKQIETSGRVGYTTIKLAPLSTIHPSKRPRIEKSTSPATKVQQDSILQIDCDSDASIDSSSYCESSSPESS